MKKKSTNKITKHPGMQDVQKQEEQALERAEIEPYIIQES